MSDVMGLSLMDKKYKNHICAEYMAKIIGEPIVQSVHKLYRPWINTPRSFLKKHYVTPVMLHVKEKPLLN
jgi:hypothetical protein